MDLLPTHVPGFDEVLDGGVPFGSVVVVAGTPGTMKTSLVYSILWKNARHGRKGLFMSLEQGADDLKASMASMGMKGVKDDEVYVLDLAALRRELDGREGEKDWVRLVLSLLEEGIEADGYELVAIDSLEALYTAMEMVNPRRDLFNFFGALKDAGVTAFLIAETPFGENRITRFGEDFLADGIFYLKHVEVGETGVQLRLRVVKMRRRRHAQGYFAVLHDGSDFTVTQVIGRQVRAEGM
jgi:circadian clock protein KaiC